MRELTKAEAAVLRERDAQRSAGWDEINKQYVLDQYVGVTLRYLGETTVSYRNNDAEKRTNLIKAAAVLLQAADRVDDGSLAVTYGNVEQKR
jgi:hypothetical protein